MKDKVGSKRNKIGAFLGSLANALLFITVIVLQIMVIWNIGLMIFGSEEDDLDDAQTINEEMKLNHQPMRESKFNERRFEIEVVQPLQEMREKFTSHPNLVFNKLSKAIQKEDKRIKDLRKEIYDIRKKLDLPIKEAHVTKEIVPKSISAEFDVNKQPNSSSWFLSSSNLFGRKLQHLSTEKIKRSADEEELFSTNMDFYSDTALDDENNIVIESIDKQDGKHYKLCPKTSPLLLGPMIVQQNNIPTFQAGTKEFLKWYGHTLINGGSSAPEDCMARQKVAIIVPYRDRKEHLGIFLHHLHPVLQRQQLDYRIFVIEQSSDGEQFNRAALMNVGYMEANKLDRYFCFVFHDVDLLPEDDRNLYICPPDSEMSVKHLSVAINKWKYRLQYKNYFGGVSAISKIHFRRMNGFPNGFYGWGGEDDELAQRTNQTELSIIRQPGNVARYTMLTHEGAESNHKEVKHLMHLSHDLKLLEDGLNTVAYTVLKTEKNPLYTRILVRLPKPEQLLKKDLYIADSGEDKKPNELDEDSLSKDSPFLSAMLRSVGTLTNEFGKYAAKEVLLYSLKNAEKQEDEETQVY